MNGHTADQHRAALRTALSAHLIRQRGARMLDEHAAERAALRAARADRIRDERTAPLADVAANRTAPTDLLAARRRDEYRAALSYPMSAEDLLRACEDACTSIGLRGDEHDETRGALSAYVLKRHGCAPMRCDVTRDWLRTRAHWIAAREAEKREHATGLKASAGIIAAWAAENPDTAAESRETGPDALWFIAANIPAPAPRDDTDAHTLAQRLELTAKQRAALALSIDSAQRVTVALSGAERKAAADARRAVRRTYPDADSIRAAVRGPLHRAAMIHAGAVRIARARAAAATHGSHLTGRSHTMARQLRPVLRPGQALTAADRVWTYGLAARDERSAHRGAVMILRPAPRAAAVWASDEREQLRAQLAERAAAQTAQIDRDRIAYPDSIGAAQRVAAYRRAQRADTAAVRAAGAAITAKLDALGRR